MEVYKYRVIVYWSEPDQRFLVEVPELPGAMADGPTPEAAAAMRALPFGAPPSQSGNAGDASVTPLAHCVMLSIAGSNAARIVARNAGYPWS